MRFFQKVKDGGPESPVDAYVLIEIKSLFSIMLLHFPAAKTRETMHSHAFNAITFWLSGKVREEIDHFGEVQSRFWQGGKIKYTPRYLLHRIRPITSTWALTVRGPWENYWFELRDNKLITLTHGRKEI